MELHTKTGDATSPRPNDDGGVIIAHIVNNIGAWGKGFVLAINKLSYAPRDSYIALSREAALKEPDKKLPLGYVYLIEIAPNLFVANMVAQDGINKPTMDACLVSYKALESCLYVVLQRAITLGCHVHMPAGMGSGLAGGDKDTIRETIERVSLSVPILTLESVQGLKKITPTITLWEYLDQTSDSYVPTTSDKIAEKVDVALGRVGDNRGIDLSDL